MRAAPLFPLPQAASILGSSGYPYLAGRLIPQPPYPADSAIDRDPPFRSNPLLVWRVPRSMKRPPSANFVGKGSLKAGFTGVPAFGLSRAGPLSRGPKRREK